MSRRLVAWRVCLVVALLATPLPALASDSHDPVFVAAPQLRDLDRQQLLDIAMVGDRLVAAGAAGLVILSDDGGASWRQADVPVSATLTALSFADAQHGWAVGHAGVILHTSDAGEHWALQFDGYRANESFLAYATAARDTLEARLDALEGSGETLPENVSLDDLEYALEDAIFMQEEAQLAVDTGPADPFLDVQFFDEQRGLAVGAYGMSFRTDNGGGDWRVNQAGIDNPDRFHLYSLHRGSEGLVYSAGEAGLLFCSHDGGVEFERVYDLYEGSLFGLVSLGRGALAFGLRGNLFLSTAGTCEWEALTTDNEGSLYGGTGLRDGGALLLGAGGTLLRLDARGREQLFRHPSRSTFSAATEAHDGTIWMVGMEGVSRFSEAQAQ